MAFCGLAVAAYSVCPVIPPKEDPQGFAAQAAPTVYILSPGQEFTPDQRERIKAALDAWGNALNVSFGQPQVVSSEPSGDNFVLVRRDSSLDPGRASTATGPEGFSTATIGRIRVSPSVTDLTPLYLLMVHEVGHLFFLGDCTECDNTAMNDLVNLSSPSGPTDCDLRAVYDIT